MNVDPPKLKLVPALSKTRSTAKPAKGKRADKQPAATKSKRPVDAFAPTQKKGPRQSLASVLKAITAATRDRDYADRLLSSVPAGTDASERIEAQYNAATAELARLEKLKDSLTSSK